MAIPREFPVEVADVGTFVFRRRSLAHQVRIEADMLRLTGGETESGSLRRVSNAIATLKVLTVNAPDGWDLEDADPLDDDVVGRVLLVFARLREAEVTFRAGAGAQRAPVGEGA